MAWVPKGLVVAPEGDTPSKLRRLLVVVPVVQVKAAQERLVHALLRVLLDALHGHPRGARVRDVGLPVVVLQVGCHGRIGIQHNDLKDG